ncbi:MAG: bifunctional 5,10-methylenetetrahydrofolate dehydrogenase/5,10-methenyltetrahydrofolate cyclohydrolase [Peptoniphilus sp.]|nr:bifunctional 5,10-methylenetetrahydrofolate dehydrogenase/5,10-methenyltetrahydrofolate cyclohydrolase [Peptoniphilus sp.]MDD7363118.1 bifunctional 5,10-methylenetetrahydrofolate dehydrogenase/5,10-methenyltetrahydrofolate cyclohydrolase [Bacillota bacterium]MDY6044360.1 bifunctional 5,10-methylenetetrahydrofolate dehydrogenase/5,10-methenyltetrahydrofolate cyclohydrolase [Peptoniphilus sp.]
MKYDLSHLRDDLLMQLQEKVARARERQVGYKLLVLRVGDKKSDISYENAIKKSAERVGVEVEASDFAELATESEIVSEIKRGNLDNTIGGILLLQPLPEHLDAYTLNSLIDHDKDVDCLTPANQWKIFTGKGTIFPATAKSALLIAKDMMSLEGKKVLIVNRSMVIGKPLAMMLLDENATVTIAHSKTENISALARDYDIVVYGTGQPEWVDASFVSEDQSIIDCGIAFNDDGKMVGDVDFEAVKDRVKHVTSVPGGVGSLTNLLLLDNMFKG